MYRAVLFDQRGAGKSTPSADVRENTTQYLIADIEALRSHLQTGKWAMAFGGSWGVTLVLAYAQTHPSVVGSLVLCGVFLPWVQGRGLMEPHGDRKLLPRAAGGLPGLPSRLGARHAYAVVLQAPDIPGHDGERPRHQGVELERDAHECCESQPGDAG